MIIVGAAIDEETGDGRTSLGVNGEATTVLPFLHVAGRIDLFGGPSNGNFFRPPFTGLVVGTNLGNTSTFPPVQLVHGWVNTLELFVAAVWAGTPATAATPPLTIGTSDLHEDETVDD